MPTEKENEEPKPETKAAPVVSKVEEVKPKDDKENAKPAEAKPTSIMGRIPLPPSKKPADQKASEQKNETKRELKPVSKPAESPKEVKKEESVQKTSEANPGKPAESARKVANQFYTQRGLQTPTLLGERTEKVENSTAYNPENGAQLTTLMRRGTE